MQKSAIGLVLQDNITIIFVWTWLFWGGCPNADLVHSLEVLDCRAARIIYNLPRDVPTDEVYRNLNWNTLILILAELHARAKRARVGRAP